VVAAGQVNGLGRERPDADGIGKTAEKILPDLAERQVREYFSFVNYIYFFIKGNNPILTMDRASKGLLVAKLEAIYISLGLLKL